MFMENTCRTVPICVSMTDNLHTRTAAARASVKNDICAVCDAAFSTVWIKRGKSPRAWLSVSPEMDRNKILLKCTMAFKVNLQLT